MSERRAESRATGAGEPLTLLNWIWRAYVRNALLPLLVVEVLLVAVYLASHAWSQASNSDALREVARSEVTRVVRDESAILQQQLGQVALSAELLRQQAARALAQPVLKREPAGRYVANAGGALTTHTRDEGAAVFYSARTRKGQAEYDKLARSAAIDPLLKDIVLASPLIVQAYLNTHDSLNRIWPWLDTATQFDPRMDITRFNFYYAADARHNPRRAVVWTDAYVDPAGQGWMVSAIAPVYRGDFLEGVVGADVQLGQMIDSMLDSPIPWRGFALLAAADGALLALSPAAERYFGVTELTDYDYRQALAEEVFKPEEFNIYRRAGFSPLANLLLGARRGSGRIDSAAPHLVSWETVTATSWTLVVMVPEAEVFASATALSARLATIGWIMLAGLVGFYALFFTFLFWRARKVSSVIAAPLKEIEGISRRVAGGEYELRPAGFAVAEFQQTLDALVHMGSVLGDSNRARAAAEETLRAWNERLSELFNFSPNGVVSFGADGTIALVNPAFLELTGWQADELVGIHRSWFWERLSAAAGGASLPPEDGRVVDFQLGGAGGRIVDCRKVEAPGGGELGYFRDITQSRELDHVKSQFLATAAHELRTPMAVISGTAEYLRSANPEGAQRDELLATISRHSGHVRDIITELLDLARFEPGASRQFRMQRQALQPALQEFVDTFRHGEDPRRPQQFGDTGSAAAEFDVDKICQALGNILANAYKYSPASSAISVEWQSSDGEVGVAVQDGGRGLDPKTQERIFDRFFRGEDTGEVHGTGLGMSIVKEIVDRHGGRIAIDSAPGRGTRVTLWLPRVTVG